MCVWNRTGLVRHKVHYLTRAPFLFPLSLRWNAPPVVFFSFCPLNALVFYSTAWLSLHLLPVGATASTNKTTVTPSQTGANMAYYNTISIYWKYSPFLTYLSKKMHFFFPVTAKGVTSNIQRLSTCV